MAKKKKQTGLMRRPRSAPAKRPAKVEATAIAPVHAVGDEIALGALGLVELKLTPAEEEILAEPVPVEAIQMKPVKVPTPYLSHPGYTRWFNRAFGRLGWAMVPAAKPMKSDNSVVCPYVLHVHGKPVAFAIGEQEYHANNKEQTYGDALEATVASALRRCAKRLGIGLELWDRRWLAGFVRDHAVCVTITKGSEEVKAWRLKVDPPFWNEKGGSRRRESPEVLTVPVEPAYRNPAAAEVITQPQRQRFAMILKNSGKEPEQVRAWLKARYGIASSADIRRDTYDEICKAVESGKPLPVREPGEE